jgi:hypothetical protein
LALAGNPWFQVLIMVALPFSGPAILGGKLFSAPALINEGSSNPPVAIAVCFKNFRLELMIFC